MKILHVDDDRDLLFLAEKFLKRQNPELGIVQARSVIEALEILEEESFDVIVSDYQMASLDGLEFLERIRSSGDTTPFIIFTGKGREEVAIKALNLGADSYIKKGGDLKSQYASLYQTIQNVARRSRAERLLIEERERAQMYLDIARVMILVLDSDGYVSLINPKGCEILGLPESEIVGKHWIDTFIPPRWHKDVEELFKKSMKGNNTILDYFENPVVCGDGEERTIAWHNAPFQNDEGDIVGVLCSGEDISERTVFLEKQKRDRQVLHQLAEASFSTSEIAPFCEKFLAGLTRTLGFETGIIRLFDDHKSFQVIASYGTPIEKLQEEVESNKEIFDQNLDPATTAKPRLFELDSLDDEIIKDTMILFGIETVVSIPVKGPEGTPLAYIGLHSTNTIHKELIDESQLQTISDMFSIALQRKLSEEALRAEEKKYRELTENVELGIMIMAGPREAIVYANPACKRITGYSVEELTQMSFDEWKAHLASEDQEMVLQYLQDRLDGFMEPRRYEVGFRNKFGHDIRVAINASVTKYRGRDVSLVTLIDITERSRLNKVQAYLASLLDHVNDAIISTDSDYRILSWNSAAEKIYGWTAEEVIRKRIHDVILPEYIDHPIEEVVEEFYSMSWQGDVIQKRKDGTSLRILSSVDIIQDTEGNFDGIVVVNKDVTDLRRAQKAQEESEEMYRALVETVPFGIAIHKDGKLVYANPAGARIAGVESPEEFIGVSVLDFLHPESLEVALSRMKRIYGDGEYQETILEKWIRLNGEVIDVEVSAGPIQFRGESASQVVFTDVTERITVEKKLRESENRWKQLLETLAEGIWVIDSDGNTTYVNERMAEMLGYSANEMTSRNLLDFMDDEMKRIAVEKMSQRQQGISEDHSFIFIKKDGKNEVHTFLKTAPIYNQDGEYEGAIAAVTDISRQMEMQRLLDQERDTLRLYLETADVILLALDTDGKVKMINSKGCEILGYEFDDIVGTDWVDNFIPARRREEVRAFFQDIVCGNLERFHYKEGAIVTRGGIERIVLWHNNVVRDSEGSITGTISSGMDITDRIESEEQLRESEARFRSIFKSAAIGLSIAEMDATLLLSNDFLAKMLGYSALEIQTMNIEDLTHPDDWKREAELNEMILSGEIDDYQMEKRYIHKNGHIIWGLLTVSVARDEDGHPEFVTRIVQDITKQKSAEEKLVETNKELSEFVHAMAHDLRGYLYQMRGIAQLAEGESSPRLFERVEIKTKRMQELLERSVILADAGIIAEIEEKVDLDIVVSETAKAIIPSEITFTKDILPTIAGDYHKIGQIFANIFENAIEHGKPTKMSVKAKRVSRGWELSVSNDGEPIPPDLKVAIFERGFSTKESGGGLGLAIVERIVEAHGWTIRLAEGNPTTFVMFIPDHDGK